jgi:hypothetical protein
MDALTELAAGLTLDGLYKLALCGTAGYLAAAAMDHHWERLCAHMHLCPARYDRCWLDTFARCLRQAAYRSSPPPVWTETARTACAHAWGQGRVHARAAHYIVWRQCADAMPWFAVTSTGDTYVYGELAPAPDLVQAALVRARALCDRGAEGNSGKGEEIGGARAKHGILAVLATKPGPASRAALREVGKLQLGY